MSESTPESGDGTRREAERRKALAWLEQKWTQPRSCPICAQANWTVTEAVEVRGFEGGNLVIGGTSGIYPLFQVICTNCGYAHFFNAVIAGVAGAGGEDGQ